MGVPHPLPFAAAIIGFAAGAADIVLLATLPLRPAWSYAGAAAFCLSAAVTVAVSYLEPRRATELLLAALAQLATAVELALRSVD